MLNDVQKTQRLALILFAFALLLLTTNAVLYSAGLTSGVHKTVPRVIAFGCLILCGIAKMRYLQVDFIDCLIIALSTIALVGGRDDALNILMIMFAGLCARALPFKQTVRILAFASCIAACLLLALNVLGLVVDRSLVGFYAGGGERLRHTLGLENPNAATLTCAGLMMIPLALGEKKKPWLICGAILVVVCIYTGTRSALLFLALMAIFLVIAKQMAVANRARQLSAFVVIVASVMAGLTLALPLLAGTPLDYALSYRPSIIKSLLAETTPAELMLGVSGSVSIDNSYLLVLLSGGVVVAALLALRILMSLRNAALAGDYRVVAFMLSVMALAMLESFLFRPEIALCSGFWALVFLYSDKSIANSRDDLCENTLCINAGPSELNLNKPEHYSVLTLNQINAEEIVLNEAAYSSATA